MPGVVIEPLSRRMWPGMVLLFVAFPHESEKLLMGGIDEGLNAEEAVLKLLDDSAEAGGTLCHVCRHISSGRSHRPLPTCTAATDPEHAPRWNLYG